MDSSASEDAQNILDALNEAGIEGVVLDEDAPGVLEGTWEVRVAPEYESRALTLIEALNQPEPAPEGDPSADLNLVTIFTGMGTTAEIEALSIQAVLQSNGIDAVIEGASELPNLPFRVKVAQIDRERAEAALAEARAAGPEAAEEASQA
jgi:aryl-alcohol dehydrogenase-like predicted oxidoreductase